MAETSKKLRAVVVHGSWDRSESLLRGRAMAVNVLMANSSSAAMAVLDTRVDSVIVFSGSKTMGPDAPSEAELMYRTFAKRLGILKSRMEKAGISSPESIVVPDRPAGTTSWEITIGSKSVTVFLEEDSVDTEDNAEKTSAILERLAASGKYDEIVVSPMSSDFHVKRVRQAFERNVGHDIIPMSAESELANAGWRYEECARLEKNRNLPVGDALEIMKRLKRAVWKKTVGARPLVGTKRVVMEVCLGLASRTEAGRKIIRMKTAKRVADDSANENRP